MKTFFGYSLFLFVFATACSPVSGQEQTVTEFIKSQILLRNMTYKNVMETFDFQDIILFIEENKADRKSSKFTKDFTKLFMDYERCKVVRAFDPPAVQPKFITSDAYYNYIFRYHYFQSLRINLNDSEIGTPQILTSEFRNALIPVLKERLVDFDLINNSNLFVIVQVAVDRSLNGETKESPALISRQDKFFVWWGGEIPRNAISGKNWTDIRTHVKKFQILGITLANTDSDGDGLTDYEERTAGSDPRDPCSPNSIDSDQDGLCDNIEIRYDLDPQNADTDNDGINDSEEINNPAYDPKNPCVPSELAGPCDKDGDGLTYSQETKKGTDPEKSDTDGDGVLDNVDECPLTPGSRENNGCERLPDATEQNEITATEFPKTTEDQPNPVAPQVDGPNAEIIKNENTETLTPNSVFQRHYNSYVLVNNITDSSIIHRVFKEQGIPVVDTFLSNITMPGYFNRSNLDKTLSLFKMGGSQAIIEVSNHKPGRDTIYHINDYFKHLSDLPYMNSYLRAEKERFGEDFYFNENDSTWLTYVVYTQQFAGLGRDNLPDYADFTRKIIPVFVKIEKGNYKISLGSIYKLYTIPLEEVRIWELVDGMNKRRTNVALSGIYYKIQLHAINKYEPGNPRYESIRKFGNRVETEPVPNSDLQRVLLGPYNSLEWAKANLRDVQENGFEKAFIVEYEDGKRVKD
ncbi:hypothetical protein [Flavilitoribacter nigricans]|uniref:SPOR domain-containing protein n=1 Tax=Flavilitoribacter nigricans (strain ATCC 23147 / DSM 23189 / NBRC 102662 / NCIMB 1420 / SS-2) TaxID=1122177 RepID=A0A2D0NAB0_FLAN2|nr:hypothetical protein [Flavilitoribacter nigricans]PHN05099.1 hypothetical protein CRP01_18940 [Flavilitoribacter nigricans DSM 23189 = NBRC 102662]